MRKNRNPWAGGWNGTIDEARKELISWINRHIKSINNYATSEGLSALVLTKRNKVVKEVGCGNIGCVFYTTDPSVVVKVTRLDEEISLINQIDHFNLKSFPDFIDHYEIDNTYLIWKEYFELTGVAAADVVLKNQGLDPANWHRKLEERIDLFDEKDLEESKLRTELGIIPGMELITQDLIILAKAGLGIKDFRLANLGANKNSDQLHIIDTMIEKSKILQQLEDMAEEFDESDFRDYYEDEDEDNWDDEAGYY
jgi:hypothetical protein